MKLAINSDNIIGWICVAAGAGGLLGIVFGIVITRWHK